MSRHNTTRAGDRQRQERLPSVMKSSRYGISKSVRLCAAADREKSWCQTVPHAVLLFPPNPRDKIGRGSVKVVYPRDSHGVLIGTIAAQECSPAGKPRFWPVPPLSRLGGRSGVHLRPEISFASPRESSTRSQSSRHAVQVSGWMETPESE